MKDKRKKHIYVQIEIQFHFNYQYSHAQNSVWNFKNGFAMLCRCINILCSETMGYKLLVCLRLWLNKHANIVFTSYAMFCWRVGICISFPLCFQRKADSVMSVLSHSNWTKVRKKMVESEVKLLPTIITSIFMIVQRSAL